MVSNWGRLKVVGCTLLAVVIYSSNLFWADSDADVKALKASNWLVQTQESIRKQEYEITWQEEAGAFHAANRTSNLRAYFRAGSVELMRRAGDINWQWDYEFTHFGRVNALQTVRQVEPTADGRKLEYEHESITEWYENREGGIEQGFVIREKPEGDGMLVLQGCVSGGLEARLASDNQSVSFFYDSEEVLRYGKLLVEDANGKVLSSRLSLNGNMLGIIIEEEGRYPLYVDPLLENPSWTAESNQEGASFGMSVASAGDVNNDGFSDVIVGAPDYDNGQSNEGRVYVYHGSPAGLESTEAWTAEGNQEGASFGHSVASAGYVNNDYFSDVIIGAPGYDAGQANEGRAYVYLGSATGLLSTPFWTAEGDQTGAYFGYSVASAGNVDGDFNSDIIVGAYQYTSGELGEGRAYVYYGSDIGILGPYWTAEGNQQHANFGCAVASAGDVNNDGFSDVIVGAYRYTNGENAEGRAYVYHSSPVGLSSTPDWSAEGNQELAFFGTYVASAGDVNGDDYSDVIVGAYWYTNDETLEGCAYVYHGSSSGLDTTANWTAEGNSSGALFSSVASAGDVNNDGYSDVIIGAPGYGDYPESSEGRAYVYQGSDTGLVSTAAWIAESNTPQAFFGYSVASAGDVNNDGYSDVIVGAYKLGNGQGGEGRAYVYHGHHDPVCDISPTSLDFDTITVGFSLDKTFTITNTGDGTLAGSVSESCSHYSIESGGGPYSLGAGEFVTVTVRFEPVSFGEHVCVIETGNISCSNVTCEGFGVIHTCCEITPYVIDFGTVCIGDSLDTTFTVKNGGGCGSLGGNITEPCGDFSIVSDSIYNLAPDESLIVTVRFEPLSVGEHICTIETDNDSCNDVICEGLCISNCEITPDNLDFGMVKEGSYKEMSFTITNICGSEILAGSVSESHDNFSIESGEGPYSLLPGEFVTVTVRFQPDSLGLYDCTIETGSENCSDVYCSGLGIREMGYTQGKRIKREWTFLEFQSNDSPGLLPIKAATEVDTYTIAYYDFETNDWQGWIPVDNSNVYGNYAGLWQSLMDKDPCGDNRGTQVEFFANPELMNYGPPSYDYNGLYETPYYMPPGLYQDEMIVSPVIDMTMYTTRTDGIQDQIIPPADQLMLGGSQLKFTIYRDLKLPSLVFYYWLVRNIEMDIPGPWMNRNLMYYGAGRDYQFETQDISDMVRSDQIQVAIGVIDVCDTWFDIYGIGCSGHTPSPWIDNIHIKRYGSEGPQWSYRSIDLFQDNFPEGEDLESTVRADMAMDINDPSNYNIRPGDSVVVSCSAWNGGGLLTNGYGAEVYLHVRCTYIGSPDPPYGPHPDLAGPELEGNYGVFIGVDGAWTIIQCDSVQTGISHPDSVKFMVDLNDSLFTRGYMLEYYFKAYDNMLNSSTIPRRAETHNEYFEFTCLPTMISDILYVDDFHGRGSIDGVAQLYMEASLEAVLYSGAWDRYDVNGPSSLVSNGLGSRAHLNHMMTAYSKVIWDSGNLRDGTISDGLAGDKSMDCELLNAWLDYSEHDVGLWICGDNIASDLDRLLSPDALILKSVNCGVALNHDSYYDLTGALGGGVVSPCVKGVPGSIFDLGTPDSLAVFGGCSSINSFDVLGTSYDAPTSQPALTYYEGCNSCSFESPGAEDSYAAITNTFTNDFGYTARTMWFGFSFMYISDCDVFAPMIRNEIMTDIINWMNNLTNPDITGDQDTPPAYTYYLERNYPNPFNPVTTIKFGLQNRGHVTLKIYNVTGRLIKTIVNETLPAGNHFRDWMGDNNHGSQVASGVYFYRIDSGSFSETKKMVLLR